MINDKIVEPLQLALVQNSIRLFSCEIEFSNIGIIIPTNAKFSTGDSLTSKLALKLTLNKEAINLNGKEVIAVIQRSDGTVINNDCSIADSDNGCVILDLTTDAIDIAGVCTFEIVVFDASGDTLVSPNCTYTCIACIKKENAVDGQNNLDLLTRKIAEVATLEQKYETAIKKIDSLPATNPTPATSVDLSDYVKKSDLENQIDTKKLNASEAIGTKEFYCSSYFQVAGVNVQKYLKSPAVEVSETLTLGGVDLGQEIKTIQNSIASIQKEESKQFPVEPIPTPITIDKLVPRKTDKPVENEIFLKQSAGATFTLVANDANCVITDNNFALKDKTSTLTVNITADGGIEIEILNKEDGYYSINGTLGGKPYNLNWTNGVKTPIILDCSKGDVLTLGTTVAGYQGYIKKHSIEDICFNSAMGVKVLAFK